MSFTGNRTLNKTSWATPDKLPTKVTDALIYNQISKTLELFTFDPLLTPEPLKNNLYLDFTKVFVIPEDLFKSKPFYPSYAATTSYTYDGSADSVVIDLDIWTQEAQEIKLETVFKLAAESIDVTTNFNKQGMNYAMNEFIGGIETYTKGLVKLPAPKRIGGDIDAQQTYAPFLSVAMSVEFLTSFIRYFANLNEQRPDLQQAYSNDWQDKLNRLKQEPEKYVDSSYIWKDNRIQRSILFARNKRGINI